MRKEDIMLPEKKKKTAIPCQNESMILYNIEKNNL